MLSGIQTGFLFPYDTSTGIYHCPSDMSTIVDANGNPLPQARVRSYNMSQSVNGDRKWTLIPIIRLLTLPGAPTLLCKVLGHYAPYAIETFRLHR